MLRPRVLLGLIAMFASVSTGQARAGGASGGSTLPAGAARESQAPPAHDGARRLYRVAAIGDSLTDPRSHGGKYLAWLQKRCPESRFDNYGKGGENVAQMRRRFARDVLGAPHHKKPAYSHVIVFGGVNDVLGDSSAGRTPERIVQDLDGMYEQARTAGIRIVGITVSPWGGYAQYYNPRRASATRAVNDWILGQWRHGRIDYAIDSYGLLSCGDAERLCGRFEMRWIRDGLHFNEDAHETLGRALHENVFFDCR